MAVSLPTLTATLSSLSFSSNISQKPNTLSFARTNTLSLSSRVPKNPSLAVTAVAVAADASPAELEREKIKKHVKSRLPGGFAAQTIIGTGRRKSAIARVVLQEGTGKIIINYREAKVSSLPYLHSFCVYVTLVNIYIFGFVDFIIEQKFEMSFPIWILGALFFFVARMVLFHWTLSSCSISSFLF